MEDSEKEFFFQITWYFLVSARKYTFSQMQANVFT